MSKDRAGSIVVSAAALAALLLAWSPSLPAWLPKISMAAGIGALGWALDNWHLIWARRRFRRVAQGAGLRVKIGDDYIYPRLTWHEQTEYGHRYGLAVPPGMAPSQVTEKVEALSHHLGGHVTVDGRKLTVTNLPESLGVEDD